MTTSIITEIGSSRMPRSICRDSVKRIQVQLTGVKAWRMPSTRSMLKYCQAVKYDSRAVSPSRAVPM